MCFSIAINLIFICSRGKFDSRVSNAEILSISKNDVECER